MKDAVEPQSWHKNLSTPPEDELQFGNLLSTKIFDDKKKGVGINDAITSRKKDIVTISRKKKLISLFCFLRRGKNSK